MLQGLNKPVILTGSQLPIGTIRTDGKENLITAIEIAAQKEESGEAVIQEVAIYFEYSLYRGNRTTKVSANAFEAFKSPNYPDLAIAGVQIQYNHGAHFTATSKQLQVCCGMDERVALIKIFPGFSPSVYTGMFDINAVKGIVLETFGSGNAPKNEEFIALLKKYINDGGVVINVTQCFSGEVVQGKYANSTFFNEIGVVSGRDLTTEAAITKLMFVLSNFEKREDIEYYLSHSMAGEMSV
jgi:L-asparaginase